jgi:hypothetical protein
MVLFGASKIITKHWFLLVNFVAQLNRRNTPLLVGKLMELQQHIQIFISYIETVYNSNNFLTSKMHSLLHTISYTIKYGVLANWSAKCFESTLFPIKQMAINSKINAIISIKNGIINWWTLNIFSKYSKEQFLKLGVNKIRAEYFSNALNENDDKEKIGRNGTSNKPKTFIVGENHLTINSLNKKTHLITNEIITTAAYSETVTTNNQFVIYQFEEKLEIVMIVAIEKIVN